MGLTLQNLIKEYNDKIIEILEKYLFQMNLNIKEFNSFMRIGKIN